jgi:hypothetical protein
MFCLREPRRSEAIHPQWPYLLLKRLNFSEGFTWHNFFQVSTVAFGENSVQSSMEVAAIYAIAAGGLLLALFLIQTRSVLINWTESFTVLLSRHLTLPVLIHRHRIWGPWTRSGVLIHVIYISTNITLVFLKTNSFTGAGRRAGELALINLIFPLSAMHLGYLADLLGITWRTCRKIHHVTGWMVVALVSFHIIAEIQSQNFSFPLGDTRNLFTMIVRLPRGIMST